MTSELTNLKNPRFYLSGDDFLDERVDVLGLKSMLERQRLEEHTPQRPDVRPDATHTVRTGSGSLQPFPPEAGPSSTRSSQTPLQRTSGREPFIATDTACYLSTLGVDWT